MIGTWELLGLKVCGVLSSCLKSKGGEESKNKEITFFFSHNFMLQTYFPLFSALYLIHNAWNICVFIFISYVKNDAFIFIYFLIEG